ncbi:MAG: ATP-binding protein [Polyangiales bacterium]
MKQQEVPWAGQTLDLDQCAQEPIHTPGHTQPWGWLLVTAADGQTLCYSSANSPWHAPKRPLPKTLQEALGAQVGAVLQAQMQQRAAELIDNPQSLFSGALKGFGRLRVVVHRRLEHWVLELLPEPAAPGDAQLSTLALGEVMARLNAETALRPFCQRLCAELQSLLAYDRVMVYRFAPDWHGWVFAESHIAGLQPFLDLHYPASDIPAQARALFLQNRLRLLPDNRYQAATLVAHRGMKNEATVDLSFALLRGVSPIHRQYLENMGVRATLTLALVDEARLWGLVACHHYAGPMPLRTEQRVGAELIAQAASMRLTALRSQAELQTREHIARRHAQCFALLGQSDDLQRALTAQLPKLAALVDSEGCALLLPAGQWSVGKVPPKEALSALGDWLASQEDEILVLDSLATEAPQLPHASIQAAGMLALRLSSTASQWLLWFRPEWPAEVHWGGDPRKAATAAQDGTLSPRNSFARWREVLHGHCRPWSLSDRESVQELRATLHGLAELERTRLRRMTEALTRHNEDLDAFVQIASHDLREPLRGIRKYAEFLREDAGEELQDAQQHLDAIERLTGRMGSLIDGLLTFSQMGELEVEQSEVDLDATVQDIVEQFAAQIAERKASVKIVEALGTVRSWRLGVEVVIGNLLSNALKYADTAPQIEIGRHDGHGELPTVYVRDHGIGIAPALQDAVFEVFCRLHGAQSYGEGQGIGLAVVRRIAQRMGGDVWLESAAGVGSTFFFRLVALT